MRRIARRTASRSSCGTRISASCFHTFRHCERSEAIQNPSAETVWIAWSQELLAMTEYVEAASLVRQIPLVAACHGLARVHLRIKRVEILRTADATQRVAACGDEIAAAGGFEALVEFCRCQQL